MNIYHENGYKDREDYLACLSEDFCLSVCEVQLLADLLSPSEDFDGLVTALEDHYGGT